MHVAVVGLIEAATKKEVEDPIVRKCLISLLNILWKKLRADPVQTEFFFQHADRMILHTNGSGRTADYSLHRTSSAATTAASPPSAPPVSPTATSSTASVASPLSPTASSTSSQSPTMDVSRLVLFTGLLPHMYATGKVGERCREALVIAAAVHEKALCRFILQLTPFCHYAVNGVISAFDSLPKTLPDKGARASGASSAASAPLASPTTATTTRRGIEHELYLITIRLRFCCTLAMVARYELTELDDAAGSSAVRTSIANELLLQFRARFLEGPLLEGLLHTSEAASRTATLYARIILEELVACCSDTSANPLLFVYIQFLLQQQSPTASLASASDALDHTDAAAAETETETSLSAQMLPTELLHRMDSLSSSLTIATIDLFTYLMELQDDLVDSTLLAGLDAVPATRRRSSSVLSPVTSNGAIWFATRFPNSAVASNVHLWKIQAFDSVGDAIDIPAADDNSEDQVLSLLSYIADAEYAACQRAPAAIDDSDTSDDESDADEREPSGASALDSPRTHPSSLDVSPYSLESPRSTARKSSGSPLATSRTAATRNAMKPLREVYLTLNLPSFSPVTPEFQRQSSLSTAGASAQHQQLTPSSADALPPATTTSATTSSDGLPLFIRVVFNRLERLLENSFEENLALSGLVAAIALKPRCASVVFDIHDERPTGQSVRTILEDVHADALRRIERLPNGDAKLHALKQTLELSESDRKSDMAAFDHEPDTRLLCGYIVLDEILKELCAVLFAKERVRNLPLKPEGYYLEPKRSVSPASRKASSDSNFSDTTSCSGLFSPTNGASAPGTPQSSSGGPTKQPSIGKEFETLLAEAESSIESILHSSERTQDAVESAAASVDAVIEALAATEFR